MHGTAHKQLCRAVHCCQTTLRGTTQDASCQFVTPSALYLRGKELRNTKDYNPDRQTNVTRPTTHEIHCLQTFAGCHRVGDACKVQEKWSALAIYVAGGQCSEYDART